MNSPEEISTRRREYQLTASQKLVYLALAAGFLIAAGFFFNLASDPVAREFALIFGFVFFIPSLLLVSLAIRSRLVLDGSRIEVRSALSTSTADRNDIEGVRKVRSLYGRWTRICLKDNRGAFNVSELFAGNDDLQEWLKGLPDLDERDAAEISSHPALGATENERLDSLQQAKIWANGLTILAVIASISLCFVSYPPIYTASLVLLALLPLLGIFLVFRFPLLFTMFRNRIDPRSDIGFVISLPGAAMFVSSKAGNDPTHLVNAGPLILWVLVVLVCFVVALFRFAWMNHASGRALPGLLIVAGLYSIGLINAVNTVPDRSDAGLYRTQVLRKYETHGRGASSYLRLAPWGPMVYAKSVSVPKSIYQEVEVGEPVCIGLHPGFLNAPWYTLTPCR